jgi:DNA repair exonuclease SbcCD ATPase subunit
MIEFQTIRYKNFLSSGNQFTEIKLNESKNTCIIGQNGAGKSTLLDALCFSLFNKPFRKINKGQIVNSQNDKDCVVEIEFAVNSTQYKIVRGIKPNIFTIDRNGNRLNEDADAKDQQKMLEDSILKLNFKSFTQIVILGSASFVPFMQLSAANRREVIEDLLDIKIFSSMSDIMKARIKDAKDRLRTMDLKKEAIADKIIMQQNFIKSIEESGQHDIQEKQNQILDLDSEVAKHQKRVEDLLVKVEGKESEAAKFADASEALRKLGKFLGKIQSKKSDAGETLKFFEDNSVCPTCTQDIEESFRVNKTVQLQESVAKFDSNLNELEEAIKAEERREREFSTLQRETTKLSNEISQTNVQISESNKLRARLEREIQTLTNRIEDRNSEHEKLSEYKGQLKQVLKDHETLKEDYNYFLQANVLLKDDGVKSSIIKKYLPLINQQVNRYLQRMDFFINFTLDGEFNEKIQSPIHENFSYPSFSEGEKMRIDLALLFTWREIARMKNSVATNLLIMDEVFDSSLDGFGTDEFMKIIRFVVKDANIFIISHKPELHDKFESVLEFQKVKGFSVLRNPLQA